MQYTDKTNNRLQWIYDPFYAAYKQQISPSKWDTNLESNHRKEYYKQVDLENRSDYSIWKILHKFKLVRSNKEGNFILIKGIIYQMDSLLLCAYIPNTGILSFIKQILTDVKSWPSCNRVIMGNFNRVELDINTTVELSYVSTARKDTECT